MYSSVYIKAIYFCVQKRVCDVGSMNVERNETLAENPGLCSLVTLNGSQEKSCCPHLVPPVSVSL